MNQPQILAEAFDRLPALVRGAVDGLEPDDLAYRTDPDANTIAWLAWHLTRIQDDHVAGVAGTEQVWIAQGWCDRFDLPFDRAATGYGQSSAEVGAVRATADQLVGYFDDVHAATKVFIGSLADSDLDRVVDRAWDPPVTLGARLVSVLSDDLQHCGQAALVRGAVRRGGPSGS